MSKSTEQVADAAIGLLAAAYWWSGFLSMACYYSAGLLVALVQEHWLVDTLIVITFLLASYLMRRVLTANLSRALGRLEDASKY